MAGDWIKLELTTCDKPEVYVIAEALGIRDPDTVLGKLIRVWAWADQQTFDGNADSVTRLLLDRITGVKGFADAMIKCGWLVENGNGLTFPNFDRHNGKTAKTRALTRDRVAKSRNAKVTIPALPREEIEKSNKSISSTSVDGAGSSKKKPTKTTRREYASAFEKWWTHYPRLVGKPSAAKAFDSAMKRIQLERSLTEVDALAWLVSRTTAYAERVQDCDQDKIKHPGPWLNDDRFNDEENQQMTTPQDVYDDLPVLNGRSARL